MYDNAHLPGSFGGDYGIGVLTWWPQCLPTSIDRNHAIRKALITDPPTREVWLKLTITFHGCLDKDAYHVGREVLVSDEDYASRDRSKPCCFAPETYIVRKIWGTVPLVVEDFIRAFGECVSANGRRWTRRSGWLLQVVVKRVVFPTAEEAELVETAAEAVLDCSMFGLL